VVPRRDEHRDIERGKRLRQYPPGIGKRVFGVEQIPRKQQDVRPLLPGRVRDPGKEPALLAPAQKRLFPVKGLKRRIEMQIRRVQDPYHRTRSASALTQRPVSVSISNRQHSIFASPLPDW